MESSLGKLAFLHTTHAGTDDSIRVNQCQHWIFPGNVDFLNIVKACLLAFSLCDKTYKAP